MKCALGYGGYMKVQHKIVIAGTAIILLMATPYLVAQHRMAQENARRAQKFSQTRPDMAIRRGAQKLKPESVAFLRLHGIHMGSFSDAPIVVKDPQVIASFIHALQNATTNGPGGSSDSIGDGVDTLEIHLKAPAGELKREVFYSFNAWSTFIWYGAGFKAALRQLSIHQARQVKTRLRAIDPRQIQEFRRGDRRVTAPDEIAALFGALQNVDEHAFAYTTQGAGRWPDRLKIVLQNGKVHEFRLVLALEAPNEVTQPLWRLYRDK
jgi:hypothetical protein